MMISLKKYAERLEPLVGLSAAALYERQRQLVRLGLVEASPRTGPGGGARATAENVAMLLLACLATDSLSDLSESIRKIARIRSRTGRCGLTRAGDLHGALVRTLSDPALAGRVLTVTVNRSEAMATITFGDAERTSKSEFGGAPRRFYFQVSATVGGALLKTVAEDLQKEA